MLTERGDRSRVETKDDFPLMWQMCTSITGPLREKEIEEVNIPAIFMPFSLRCGRNRGMTLHETRPHHRDKDTESTWSSKQEEDGLVLFVVFDQFCGSEMQSCSS